MLNNFQCEAATAAAYQDMDTIVLMLCRECAASVNKLGLPAAAEKMVSAYTAKYSDIYETASVRTLSVLLDGRLVNIVIAGCGEGRDCKPVNFRKAAGEAARQLKKLKSEKAAVAAPILLNPARSHYLQAIAEGLYLGAYSFTRFKSVKEESPDCRITIAGRTEGAQAAAERAEIIAAAVCLARDLVNRPGNDLNPEIMADLAEDAAKEYGLKIEILDEAMMEAKGMNAMLAVGQGSVHGPRMITLKYNGAGDAPYTAYVGKGITFDSGGISLKPGENMGDMKDDMTGSADVLAAVIAAARLKLPCNLMGIMACAENMPGGKAQRPGDIVRAASGKTIEVVSTDAEGRMVLADAVWYACRQGAARVIDIATLTGAVIIALGTETSGIISNDSSLVREIIDAGHKAGENYWQLPSLPECREANKSSVADLLNSAGREGGCITGGLFVGEFVDKDIPWAHIDIGGTATAEKTAGFKVKGGTGFGTMTLIRLAGSL